jgi:hypothetical protein
VGHLGLFIDRLDELQGYNLLDVFFPKYGDAYTARITRLLTGTPYGPVDFVLLDKATPEHLQSFGVLACLGHGMVRGQTEARLLAAAANGSQVILGAQDFAGADGTITGKPFGLAFDAARAKVEGEVTGLSEIFSDSKGRFSGELWHATGGDQGLQKLELSKPVRKLKRGLAQKLKVTQTFTSPSLSGIVSAYATPCTICSRRSGLSRVQPREWKAAAVQKA